MAPTSSARTFFQSPFAGLFFYFVLIAGLTTVVYRVTNPGWVLWKEARGLMARGDFVAALPVMEQARAAGLPPGGWQEDLAEALLRAGRGAEVLELFPAAETLSLARTRLVAGAYEQTQKPQQAFEKFSQYLAGGGELDPAARLQYAGVLRQAKRFAEAEAAYRAVLSTDPHSTKARFELAELQAWQGRFREALPTLTELVAAHPGDRAMRLALARVLTWSGDYAGAEKAYRELLSSP